MRAFQRLLTATAIGTLAVGLYAPSGQASPAPGTRALATGSLPAPAATGVASASTAGVARTPAVTPHPVTPTVASYPVRGVGPAALASLSPAARRQASGLAALSLPEPASGYAVAGVTWTGATPPSLAMQIRTRTNAVWSSWKDLGLGEDQPDARSAEARHATPGTDPYVVGAVDQVQVRVSSADGKAPSGLTLAVIDPGHSQDDRPAMVAHETTASAAAATDPIVSANPTPMPTIYSRADWGADESMRGCCTQYGEIHAGFVHHTVNANHYSRGEVPAILRGIYAYHTQSRGWRDIGYNFLIDRFGRIWEGRYGGIALPVVGAHTLNYNEASFGTSAIGNFQIAHPSASMIDSYARLFAWKLSLSGVRPSSRQDVAGRMLNAINGHRDVGQTACPGIHLYRKIPQIIRKAAAYQHGYSGRATQHSFLRDAAPDILTVDKTTGQLGMARGTGAPGFAKPVVAMSGVGGYDQVVAVGDVTGDKAPDLMARSSTDGSMQVFAGNGAGAFSAAKRSFTRFSTTDLFAGPGDVNGDGTNDVVARDDGTGSLMLYNGLPSGGFAAGVVAVAKAAGLNTLSAAGDFNGDGFVDLVGRGPAGHLHVYLGDGTGAFATSIQLAGAWQRMDVVAGGVDLTGDGRPDVVARRADNGVTKVYANIGGTRLAPGTASLAPPSPALTSVTVSPDVTGDRNPDLVGLTSTGSLEILPAQRRNWFTPSRARSAVWPGVNRVMVVGDWNRDGYVDAMSRSAATGRMWLYLGTATGGLGDRVGGWRGWKGRSLIAPVGDFDGDGHPDLMARAPDGHVWLYPGRGMAGFAKPVRMRSSLHGGVGIVAAGLWTRDGAPDVMVKTRRGRLLLYPGNGPGGLEDPVLVKRKVGQYDTIVGVGDVTGDGRDDLVARTRSGDVYLLAGTAPSASRRGGGLAPKQYLASGWSSYYLG